MTRHLENRPRDPAKAAEELARLAAGSRDPAERLWYLQWAQAFRQLAAFGDRSGALESDLDVEEGRSGRG